jgi:hypothetical protein
MNNMAYGKMKYVAEELYDGVFDFLDYIRTAVNAKGKGPFGEVVIGVTGAVFGTPPLYMQLVSKPNYGPLETIGIYVLEAAGIAGYGMIADYAFLNSGLLAWLIGVPKERYLKTENRD